MKPRQALASTLAILVLAILVLLATRAPREESPAMPEVESPPEAAGPGKARLEPPSAESSADPSAAAIALPDTANGRRILVEEEAREDVKTVAGTRALRVVLEETSAAVALEAKVTVTGAKRVHRPPGPRVQESWPCQGTTTEFDLEPFFARVSEQLGELRDEEFQVRVEHPLHLSETIRLSLSSGVESASGRTVYEARVRLVRPEFWPEFELSVRDARTRAHLEDVELEMRPGAGMARWGSNPSGTSLGRGLSSPIALRGGRDGSERRATVAGMAISPAPGGSPRIALLPRRFDPERGVIVSARAPGYAWATTSVDVTKGDRELLLEPSATLAVRLTNVQLERYAALEVEPMLCVYWIREDGGNQYAHFEPLDEELVAEGLRLESLVPGGYRVAVELGGGSWTEQPVLALEELALIAGETSERVLALADPPELPERAALGGVISFPAPPATWSEERVRLQLYFQPTQRWRKPDVEFSLEDLPRVGGELPTWSFRVEDLPVGLYRVQLLPFLKVWMIDLTADGAEELELVIPELAEVLAQTVDARTGERVPRKSLYFRGEQPLPRQRQNDFTKAETLEPGRFRFRAAPGRVMLWPKFPTGADRDPGSGEVFELVAGPQSVRLELEPVQAMRLEFRVDGTALPTGPQGMRVSRDVRAVDHEGHVSRNGLQSDMRLEVSAPGTYELRFDGVTAELYHPLPPRRVEVLSGETTDVIVELRRR